MIIFLYGPDDYRREQKKKFYIQEFKKKYSGLSVGYFDLTEEGALEELRAFLRGQSLFQEKKLAAAENIYLTDEKRLAEALRPIVAKKATIFLSSESKKPPKALAFLLEKPNMAEEFENLEGPAWNAFIKKSAEGFGLGLEPEALRLLAEVYKNNTWGLMTELQKLSNFGKKVISKKDLEALGLETLPNYWVTMNGLRGPRLESRLWALEKMLAQKEPPAKLFNILASMWREKTPQMAEQDFKIKSGKLEYDEALVDLIV